MTQLQPDDPRPAKYLARLPEHAAFLADVIVAVQAEAAAKNLTLQANFEPDCLALIGNCNQFVRVYRQGKFAGQLELPPGEHPEGLEGATPHLGVFAMFGWKRFAPTSADGLVPIIVSHLEAAWAKGKPKL